MAMSFDQIILLCLGGYIVCPSAFVIVLLVKSEQQRRNQPGLGPGASGGFPPSKGH